MKILHLSDLHIGKKIFDRSLLEDQRYVLNQALQLIDLEKIDLVIISGDIFDTSIASAEAIKVYGEFTNSLIFEKKVKVVAIAGNHDSSVRLQSDNLMKENVGYFIRGELKGKVDRITLKDEYGEIDFYPIPYLDPIYAKNTIDESIKNYDDIYKYLLENIDFREKIRSVCLAHAFVTASKKLEDKEKLMDEVDERDRYQIKMMVAGQEAVRSSYFEKFSYTGLGHIHRSYRISDNIYYCGSLLKYDFAEVGQTKHFQIVNIGKKNTEIKKIPVEPMREMKIYSDYFDNFIKDYDFDDSYIMVELLDYSPKTHAKEKLNTIFPNLLKISYKNLTIETKSKKVDLDKLTFEEVIEAFYRDKLDRNLDEDEREIVNYVQNMRDR